MKLSIDIGDAPNTRIPAKGKLCVTQARSKMIIDMDCKCGRIADVTHIVSIEIIKAELAKRKE